MQEVIMKINGKVEKISASMVFHSRNPKTEHYSVNLYYIENNEEKWIQLFCQEEEKEEPAKELALGIRKGKITDLTGYSVERRL